MYEDMIFTIGFVCGYLLLFIIYIVIIELKRVKFDKFLTYADEQLILNYYEIEREFSEYKKK